MELDKTSASISYAEESKIGFQGQSLEAAGAATRQQARSTWAVAKENWMAIAVIAAIQVRPLPPCASPYSHRER